MKIKMKTRPACSKPKHNPGLDAALGMPASAGSARSRQPASGSGFTLVEAIVATLVAAVVLPAFYASLAAGFASMKAAREDLRATQVILQRMEAIRLSPYKTLQDPAAYPAKSTEYYSESGKTNGAGGTAYTISYSWAAPGSTYFSPSYRSNVLLVTVAASWNQGNVQHSRSMQTYVARYGIQRYVAGN